MTNTLVNPLVPSVLNPADGSDFGNLGFMRPQLRAERYIRFGDDLIVTPQDDLIVTPQVALSSPIGTDFFQQLNVTGAGAQLGEENGWPNVEGRLAVGVGEKVGGARFRPIEFGVSGLVGELRFTRSDFVSPARRFTTLVWMYGADVRWQLTPELAVTAKAYYGNALGSYTAGNKQTFNTDTGRGIRASGGFVELEYKFNTRWIAHAGYMLDNPLDRDVPLTGRVWQQNSYANVMYVHNRYLQAGFEVARVQAGFQNPVNGDNAAWVVHNKIILTF